jgi:hypothetical protein
MGMAGAGPLITRPLKEKAGKVLCLREYRPLISGKDSQHGCSIVQLEDFVLDQEV